MKKEFDYAKPIKLRKDNNEGVMLRVPREMVRMLGIKPGQIGTIAVSRKDNCFTVSFEEVDA